MASELATAIAQLSEATRGINWSADRTQSAVDVILRASKRASSVELDQALRVLVARLRELRIDRDADGTGQIAITAGSLVEFGASPAPLADALLELLPGVLRAARRYADICLADPRTPAETPDEESDDILFEIDGRPILRAVFRSYLEKERPAAACLSHLMEWTMPSVAAWTRHRPALVRAAGDRTLVKLADELAESQASWLRTLLSVQLDATWLVLCPLESRGFEAQLDGIVSNHDLHALLAAALVPLGIPGEACSRAVISYLEGAGEAPRTNHVRGTWNLYDYRAVAYDLTDGAKVPLDVWAWGEGIPTDVPRLDDVPTLLVGPPSIVRSWSLERTFCALKSRVTVARELSATEYEERLARAKRATGAHPPR
jgi:hypothetical protein